MQFIACIEKALGKTAKMNFLPLQPGDVPDTYADIEALADAVGFRPSTPLDEGVRRFVEWYRTFYSVPSDAQGHA
jgi:UDP-glucuronate 4-epimerase